jgi:hypothetical protein
LISDQILKIFKKNSLENFLLYNSIRIRSLLLENQSFDMVFKYESEEVNFYKKKNLELINILHDKNKKKKIVFNDLNN